MHPDPAQRESETPSSSNTPNGSTPQPTTTTTTTTSRKRKRAPVVKGSSPAPLDQATNGANATDLLATSRADLSSRPILTISRGPVFIPVAEGSEWNKTEMVGVNRLGYRYIPAGINPPGYATPCRTIESNPTSYRISWEDRSPFIKVSQDGLSLIGSKGFRSARCNAPMREGKYYMEIKILRGGGENVGEESRREGSHVRLGWGRREAPLNAPVGLDGYSYGYRDKTGEKATLSRPRPYGQPFGTGDVVGLYISLPPREKPNPKDPHDPAHLKRERIPIDLRGQEVFEILEYQASKEMIALMDYSGKTTNSGSVPSTTTKKSANGKLPERGGPAPPGKANSPNLRPLPILHGSRIAFFLNGKCQGTAFQDIYDYLPLRQTVMQRKANSKKKTREGVKEHRENPFDDGTLGYYPFISLFNDAAVRLNPGPDFDFPPPDNIDQLLDRMAGEEAFPSSGESKSSQPTSAPDIEMGVEMDVKPDRPPLVSDVTPQLESTQRTWRPAIHRYPEFMQEEWELDALEEQEAKVELQRLAKLELVEEEKKRQKEKKKEQAEARKRARKEAAGRIAKEVKDDEERGRSGHVVERDGSSMEKKGRFTPSNSMALLGPGMPGPLFFPSHIHSAASPSPLRYSTSAYDHQLQNGVDQDVLLDLDRAPESEAHSPAPTYASYGDFTGGHSGYTSENNPEKLQEQDHETDNDMDLDHELEAMIS